MWLSWTRTPQTEGYEAYVVFHDDGVFERFQDGKLVEQSRYRFAFSGLDLSGLSIYIGVGDGAPHAFGVSADTLVLDRSPVDGAQSIYERRNR